LSAPADQGLAAAGREFGRPRLVQGQIHIGADDETGRIEEKTYSAAFIGIEPPDFQIFEEVNKRFGYCQLGIDMTAGKTGVKCL
jgi:hypothetical protein